jgi:glycosyltransferase involved in cell wall biosynthesis
MKKPILTIAIPTYNRPAYLLKTVDAIIPQLNEYTTLLIIDNHSDVSIETVLHDKYLIKDINIKVVRNITNIGGAANTLRCFEYCQTPYIWTLGDDDVPKINAVSIILDFIKDYPDVIFFNFNCDLHLHKRNHTFFTVGLSDFVNNFDNYSNLLFISNNIYKHKSVISNIRFAYHYTYSAATQLAILIQSLKNEDSQVCFSKEKIVTNGIPENGNHFSVVIQSLGYNILVELPIIVQNGLSITLGKRLAESKLSILLLFREILFLSDKKTYNKKTSRYLFNQILYRRYYFRPRYYWFYRVILRLFFRYRSTILYFYKKYWELIKKREYVHVRDSYYNPK